MHRRSCATSWLFASTVLGGCVCLPGVDLTARYEEPLRAPLELRPGAHYSNPFLAQSSGTHSMRVEYTRNEKVLSSANVDCLLGRYSHQPCPRQYQRLRFLWQVESSGSVVAKGISQPPSPEERRLGFGLPIDQSFGTFVAKRGETYVVKLIVENDAYEFNELSPKLVVLRNVPGLCEPDRWGK